MTAFVDGRTTREELVEALVGLGVAPEHAVGYAHVLDAAPTGTAEIVSGALVPPLSDSLGPKEAEILAAIAACILPTMDTPGAAEADAANYVTRALTDPYRRLLPTYRQALDEINAFCAATLGAPFVDLNDAQQASVLRDLEAGGIEQVQDAAEFFRLVRKHVLEGVFCEPHHGGNRGMVGWRLVGFPGQRYGYPDPYINKEIDLPPIAVEGPPRKEA
jgi:hypothetical protein